MEPITTIDFILNTVIAMVAGVCVGIERQMKNKNAGLKTNALVAIGASIFVGISFQFLHIEFVDLTRIISQVVVGVGFLGAGVNIKRKNQISGLATAAAVWCSAALGCLAAMGMYIEVATSTALIVLVNLVLGHYNKIIYERNHSQKKPEKKYDPTD
jgi:putative Mg2+ transporter-C (MgtC) family protein